MGRKKKDRKRIHQGMARNGGRPPLIARLEQSAKDKKKITGYSYTPAPITEESRQLNQPLQKFAEEKAKGIIDKLFKRGISE